VARDLVVEYGSYRALRGVTLDLPERQYAILVGENGAGKSTLLKCLAGWLRPTEGAVAVRGLDWERHERAIRRWIKYVPDTPQFYPELTAWEHMEVVAQAHGLGTGWHGQARSLLDRFSLDAHARALPASFSRGMQYKLAVALCLLTEPAIFLLDEPFGPLDPYSQHRLASCLAETVAGGATVLASTHVLPDGDPPERVLVLDRGLLAADVALSTWWDGILPLSEVPGRLLRDTLEQRAEGPDA
jgi:ABC-2 type transport system ATP-binding protein